MSNQLITESNERIKGFLLTLDKLSSALERMFSSRKTTLDGESFYTDEELSKKLKISRRSLQDYRNEGRIPYIKLGGKILYRSSDIEKIRQPFSRKYYPKGGDFRRKPEGRRGCRFIPFFFLCGQMKEDYEKWQAFDLDSLPLL